MQQMTKKCGIMLSKLSETKIVQEAHCKSADQGTSKIWAIGPIHEFWPSSPKILPFKALLSLALHFKVWTYSRLAQRYKQTSSVPVSACFYAFYAYTNKSHGSTGEICLVDRVAYWYKHTDTRNGERHVLKVGPERNWNQFWRRFQTETHPFVGGPLVLQAIIFPTDHVVHRLTQRQILHSRLSMPPPFFFALFLACSSVFCHTKLHNAASIMSCCNLDSEFPACFPRTQKKKVPPLNSASSAAACVEIPLG
jgi:hypothetical protein